MRIPPPSRVAVNHIRSRARISFVPVLNGESGCFRSVPLRRTELRIPRLAQNGQAGLGSVRADGPPARNALKGCGAPVKIHHDGVFGRIVVRDDEPVATPALTATSRMVAASKRPLRWVLPESHLNLFHCGMGVAKQARQQLFLIGFKKWR